MNQSNPYEGKVVVITGASSGFGYDTALQLARRGAQLALAARSAGRLHELARDCETLGASALAVPTDVSDSQAVRDLARRTIQAFGHFDVWINDAGVASIGHFDEVPLDDHEQVIRTNLLGTLAGSYSALHHFLERRRGTLINIASIIGRIPTPLYASYVASKFGVVGLSDALRQELRHHDYQDVRVCTVMPMAHATEFFEHAGNYTGHKAVPIPPTYDRQVTVDALVKLVVEPEDEVITGRQGVMFDVLHRFLPGSIERLMATNTEKAQLEAAPRAPRTSGAVHTASESYSEAT